MAAVDRHVTTDLTSDVTSHLSNATIPDLIVLKIVEVVFVIFLCLCYLCVCSLYACLCYSCVCVVCVSVFDAVFLKYLKLSPIQTVSLVYFFFLMKRD